MPAAKTKLQALKAEAYVKAGEMYKKALEIDPNYFEANLNLRLRNILTLQLMLITLLINYQLINKKNMMQQLPKSKAQFELAKPYLVKAVELQS
jgi:tetratricopeptide (TPR) repeat protein